MPNDLPNDQTSDTSGAPFGGYQDVASSTDYTQDDAVPQQTIPMDFVQNAQNLNTGLQSQTQQPLGVPQSQPVQDPSTQQPMAVPPVPPVQVPPTPPSPAQQPMQPQQDAAVAEQPLVSSTPEAVPVPVSPPVTPEVPPMPETPQIPVTQAEKMIPPQPEVVRPVEQQGETIPSTTVPPQQPEDPGLQTDTDHHPNVRDTKLNVTDSRGEEDKLHTLSSAQDLTQQADKEEEEFIHNVEEVHTIT